MTLDSIVWYAMPSSRAREWARLKSRSVTRKVDPPGLVERVASRLPGRVELPFGVGCGAQLPSLEPVENVTLFRAHFLVHDGRLRR